MIILFEGAVEGIAEAVSTITRIRAEHIAAYHDVSHEDEEYPTLIDVVGGGSYYVTAKVEKIDKIMEEWCIYRQFKKVNLQ